MGVLFFFFPLGLFSVSLISGGSIGVMNRKRGGGIGEGLVDVFVIPVAFASTISTVCLAMAAVTNSDVISLWAGVSGFVIGLVAMRPAA